MALTFGAATSDRVALSAGLDDQHTFTVLAWVYVTTLTGARRFYEKGSNTKYGRLDSVDATMLNMNVGRATIIADAITSTGAISANTWTMVAFTYDGSDGPRIFTGGLATEAAEASYTLRTVGSGSETSDSGQPWCVANRLGTSDRALQGRVAVFAHYRRRFSLAEIVRWQFLPTPDVDCDIFMNLGYDGTGTQANKTSLGNGKNGTVTGATVSDHAPLPALRTGRARLAVATPSLPGWQRLVGPRPLPAASQMVYTVPAGRRAVIRHIHAYNPGGAANLTLSIGTDAAATRLYDAYPLTADVPLDNRRKYVLAEGETIQAFASVADQVVLTIHGEERPEW